MLRPGLVLLFVSAVLGVDTHLRADPGVTVEPDSPDHGLNMKISEDMFYGLDSDDEGDDEGSFRPGGTIVHTKPPPFGDSGLLDDADDDGETKGPGAYDYSADSDSDFDDENRSEYSDYDLYSGVYHVGGDKEEESYDADDSSDFSDELASVPSDTDDDILTAMPSELREQYAQIESDMMVVTKDMIKSAVESAAFDHNVEVKRLQSLVHVAFMWGRLDHLVQMLEACYQQGSVIWVDAKTGGLGDVLSYLARKVHRLNVVRHKLFFTHDYTTDPTALEEIRNRLSGKLVILMDEVMTKKARTDGDFRETILRLTGGDGKPIAKMVAPMGWLAMNAFTILQYKERINFLALMLKRKGERASSLFNAVTVDIMMTGENTYHHKTVRRVYGEDYDRMDKATKAMLVEDYQNGFLLSDDFDILIADWCKMLGLETVRPMTFSREVPREERMGLATRPYETLASLIRPKIPSEHSYMASLIELYECKKEDDMVESLQKDGLFLSMARLAVFSKTIRASMDRESEQPTHYYLPTEAGQPKSYTMAAMVYQMANPDMDITNKIVSHSELATILRVNAGSRRKFKIMVLDDYAGSGQSLIEVAIDIYKLAMDAMMGMSEFEVVVAPMVESELASRKFKAANVRSVPGHSVVSLVARGDRVQAWMGGPGFSGGYYFITMPYMSPDNNCWAASHVIAPLFVLDRKGVKESGTHPPQCSPLTGIALLMGEALNRHETENRGNPNIAKEKDKTSSDILALMNYPQMVRNPACFGFVMQYYCKMDSKNNAHRGKWEKRGSAVSFADMSLHLVKGSWSADHIGKEKPSAQCAEFALSMAQKHEILEKATLRARGGSGSAFRLADMLYPELCQSIMGPDAWQPAVYARDSVGNTGMFGFDSSAFVPEKRPAALPATLGKYEGTEV